MIAAGARQICMVISAEKTDIVKYFAERQYAAEIFYVVQQNPLGLCDALFRAEPFARDQSHVLIGLPDTIWFPENAYRPAIESGAEVNLICFPVTDPSVFDAVVSDDDGAVRKVEVKQRDAHSCWVWGAVTTTGKAFHALKLLWEARHRGDEYLGHLLNAYMAAGNQVHATHNGEIYMDVGTLPGYHAALDFLRSRAEDEKIEAVKTA
jgi:dTDP-glucose pyrophosphorylase